MRRWLVATGQTLAWAMVFVASVGLGLTLHANVPALRLAFGATLNNALEGNYRGRVSISGLDHLSVSSAVIQSIQVWDESGTLVLKLEGVKLRYRPFELAQSLLQASSGPITLDHVRVDRSQVVLVSDPASGEWTLARALSKAKPSRARRPRQPQMYSFSAVELGQLDAVLEHPSLGKLETHLRHVHGSADVGGEDTQVSVQRFGVELVGNDGLALKGTGSLRLLPRGYASGTFHGFVDATELDVSAQFDANVLRLRLDIPRALPAEVRRRLPGWPLEAEVSATLVAEGPLDNMQLTARLSAGGSSADVTGECKLGSPPTARLNIAANALDARLFWPTAPATNVAAHADVQLTRGTSGWSARVEAETDPTTVMATQLPAAQVSLSLEATETKGTLHLTDARGSLDADLVLKPSGAIEVRARASRVDLKAWPQLAATGTVELEANASIEAGQMDGQLDGRFSRFASGPVALSSGRVSGTFSAPIRELEQTQVALSLTANTLQVGALEFEQALLSARGPWDEARFETELSTRAGAHGTVKGKLDLRHAAELEGMDVTWSEPALTLTAHVSHWAPERGALRVDRFQVSGQVGKLQGSAQIEPRQLDVTIDADALDTALLTRTFGASLGPAHGLVTGHFELATGPGAARGTLDVDVKQFGTQTLLLGAVKLRAKLNDKSVEASFDSVDSPLGQLSASTALELAGPILDGASWQDATFAGSVQLEEAPLWPVGMFVSKSGIRDLDGRLHAALQIKRSDPSAYPSLFLQAGTRELTFTLPPGEGGGKEGTTLDRFALHASASIDGQSGRGAATVLITDEHGGLVTTSGSLDLDLHRLVAAPGSIVEQLLRTPLDGLLQLHRRPLSLLPSPLGVRDLPGSVEASVFLRGSLSEPALAIDARGYQLLGTVTDGGQAVDVTSIVHYSPNTGLLTGHANVSQANKSLVTARLLGNVPNPLSSPLPWQAAELRAIAMLNGVPLELWPAAARQGLRARLYGSVDIERRGQAFRQRAQLEIGELSADGHVLGNGRLSVEGDGDGIEAELRLGSKTRYLHAKLGGAALEAEHAESALQGSLVAQDFDASALSSLLGGIVTHLAGSVDAHLDFKLRPRLKSGYYLGVDGRAQLTGGTARLDLFGLEVRELTASVSARSTPEYTVIQFDPIQARAQSRTPNLHGDAELWLEGFRVISGEANVSLDEVPLNIAGASWGTARGQAKARLERTSEHLSLEIKIPALLVKLPASSTRTLIGLEPNPDLRILQVAEEDVAPPDDALLWKIAFELGEAVRVQRADLDVALTGHPRLDYRHEPRPSGTIEALPGGRITLFDQTFTIDRAVVQFVPDEPDNPRLDLTASWHAPDGTTVYVDITGSAKQPRVLTRDDRGLQDVERLYLVTGNAESIGGQGAMDGDAGAPDARALGQTFALGINEWLRGSVGNVAVSVGTTRDDRASYGASVRLSDKLSFQGNFQPASANNLEESTDDLTGTLDYRFTRRWSLRTELGTSGGAFDLLWSHRY